MIQYLNTVDVIFSRGEFIMTMFDSEMFIIASVNQAIIITPIISIYNAIRVNFASNYALNRLSCAIRDNFSVNFILTAAFVYSIFARWSEADKNKCHLTYYFRQT